MYASKSLMNGVKSLHKAIEEGNINEVKSLLSKLPVDKNYFDVNNISAAAVAIKWEQHEIYELLLAEGIYLGHHEWMDEATSGQKIYQKINLREIHKRYFNDPNLKHLVNLITSTKLSHEASSSDRREHLRLITEAFEDLNGLKSIEPILKVASTSQKLKIVFDFNRDSVEFLDPVQNRNVEGLCYTKEGIIYVGSKDLKEKEKRCVILGVLIHELTHFVMELIYDNGAKPYQLGNQEKINKFIQVVVDTAAKKESEPRIALVYDSYPVSSHHAELIVRVPHLTALYKDDENKTIEVQQEFSELFDYFEENTSVDLKREFPLMEVKYEIRELNELCGTLAILKAADTEMSSGALGDLDLKSLSSDKILFISSNCPLLTLSAILQQNCTDIKFETSFIFADLKSMKNEKIFNLAAKALALFTNPSLIVDCQGDIEFDAVMGIVKKLNEKEINQKVIFILDKSSVTSRDANVLNILHSWNHLTINSQQKLLQKKVVFKGTEMLINELLNDLNSIETIPFLDLLNNRTIVIGKEFNIESSVKLIERKFLPSNFVINIYRSLKEYTIEQIEHDLNELLTFTKQHQTILISDEPGMGKSTSLKMLYLKLSQKYPSHWIVLMDLKDNFEAYQVSCLEVHKREDIAKFLTEKVLKIESFEAQIFNQLFNEDHVILLMDGLDEICPSYKPFIFSLMKDIQKFSKNELWISTRPHLVEELKNELNPISFTLKPFTEANRREFFKNHFNEDQNSDLKLIEIESFLGKLKPYFGQTNDVCNPLVMRMIVEILDEDQNLKLSEANYFVIYDRFTEKLIDKCQDKGSEAKKDFVNWVRNSNINKFYQQQAFLTCFRYGNNSLMRKELIDPQFNHVCKPSADEIFRLGLMFFGSSGNLHFIHQTFAEFYVAKFFYEMIFKFTNLQSEKYLNTTIKFLLKYVLEEYEFDFIRILLDNALDSEERQTIEKFPLSTLKLVRENMDRDHFKLLVRSGCFSLIKFFILHLYPDDPNILFSTDLYSNQNFVMVAVENQSVDFIKRIFALLNDLNGDNFKKLLFERDIENRNSLFIAASNSNSDVFNYIIEFYESLMTRDELRDNLMQKSRTFKIILHSAVKNDRKIDFVFGVLEQRLSLSQLKILLGEVTDDNRCNLLQYALKFETSVANLKSLISVMRQVLDSQGIKILLLHENSKGFKVVDLALTNKNELVLDVIRNFYLEVFGDDKMRKYIFNPNNCTNWFQEESFLYFKKICFSYESYYDGAFKKFLSFIMDLFAADSLKKEYFLNKDGDGEIFFKFAVMELGTEDFGALCLLLRTNDLMDFPREILQQRNSRGECAFHWAAKGNNSQIFHKVRKLYEESFDAQNFRQIIVSCDKSWILDVIEMNHYQNSENFRKLCHFLKKLFEGTEEIEKLKDFLLFADKSGQTAFMAAARSKNKEFKYLYVLTKELYTIETVKDLIQPKNVEGATAFTYSFIEGLGTTFEFVKSVFVELIEKDKMQEIVLVKVRSQNILSLSIDLSSSLDLFETLCNYFIKLFEDDAQKFKIIFVSVDRYDQTVLMKSAQQTDLKYFEILVNVIEKLFDRKEVVEILTQRNQEGKTAFSFSKGNDMLSEKLEKFYN